MSERSFNYVYVTLPQAQNIGMILTPILNVEEEKSSLTTESNDNDDEATIHHLTVNHDNDNESNENESNTEICQTITSNETTIVFDGIIDETKPNEIVELKTEDTHIAISIVDAKRMERLQKDIIRKKMARMRETQQQRMERLQKDRERKKLSRQRETMEQRSRRLEKDRLRIQRRRALETEEERRKRLEKNRISKRNARIKENTSQYSN
ncbi:hypothetical protein SSS_00709 [Sarcoptes scabiei]|uniref:Uncharacterized protein n=1 Tax=Sarcoptes scabiei TaxID=52283 RepID=A0A132A7C3_SARSC|nr:hypothetical protein SSS_00709 [Sarcoptes scabiei]KPM06876.1 hypothetical protein QR98_0053560 [Sarcoptes scabiei]UXI14770.1 hypothetical protein NH340_JMT00713 [Sarcoptes scabiei]